MALIRLAGFMNKIFGFGKLSNFTLFVNVLSTEKKRKKNSHGLPSEAYLRDWSEVHILKMENGFSFWEVLYMCCWVIGLHFI